MPEMERDENGDIVMDANVNVNININLKQPAFTPSPPRKRNSSNNAIQNQIEMAKEAAARFGSSNLLGNGNTNMSINNNNNNNLDCNHVLSPSEMSESNFRTPVPAPRKGWFHIRDQEWSAGGAYDGGYGNNNNNNQYNQNSSAAVGLFLPGLFGSASEEDLCRHSSGSLLDLMKVAFSPSK